MTALSPEWREISRELMDALVMQQSPHRRSQHDQLREGRKASLFAVAAKGSEIHAFSPVGPIIKDTENEKIFELFPKGEKLLCL